MINHETAYIVVVDGCVILAIKAQRLQGSTHFKDAVGEPLTTPGELSIMDQSLSVRAGALIGISVTIGDQA